MASFDPRLLRPRVIPALAKTALTIVEMIDRAHVNAKTAPRSPKVTQNLK
jgi:hypothetical protein